jgi:hypothetical protein
MNCFIVEYPQCILKKETPKAETYVIMGKEVTKPDNIRSNKKGATRPQIVVNKQNTIKEQSKDTFTPIFPRQQTNLSTLMSTNKPVSSHASNSAYIPTSTNKILHSHAKTSVIQFPRPPSLILHVSGVNQMIYY